MKIFGKKLKDCRAAKELTQNELAKLIEAHHSIIGKYERDQAKPTIDMVKKSACFLDTTVAYLHGETPDRKLLKDPAMLEKLDENSSFKGYHKEHIRYTKDGLRKSEKIINIAAL